jgi:hypothetical protein
MMKFALKLVWDPEKAFMTTRLALNFLMWEQLERRSLWSILLNKDMSMGCYQPSSMPNSICLLPL